MSPKDEIPVTVAHPFQGIRTFEDTSETARINKQLTGVTTYIMVFPATAELPEKRITNQENIRIMDRLIRVANSDPSLAEERWQYLAKIAEMTPAEFDAQVSAAMAAQSGAAAKPASN